MRIVLATPLYPPEIAEPAPYVKELAKRLSERHTVTIVAYTRLPERVLGVPIVAVDKRRPLLLRLIAYFFAILQTARKADIVYAMNGTSVELPVALMSYVVRRPLIVRIGDTAAHTRAQQKWFSRFVERFAFSRAERVIDDAPLIKPEIIPFEPFPTEKFTAHEESWDAHIRVLEDAFNHASS